MRIRFLLLLALGAIAMTGRSAGAQPLSPIAPALFAFPGGTVNPASGASAGTGGADRWLGDEPFDNPAAPAVRRVLLSPTMLRVSRQDLRADNRNFDDQEVFFDLSGAALGLGPRVPVWVYVQQPTLRFEDYVFSRGTGIDPSVTPAIIRGQSDTREGRAGLAASMGWGRMRGGAAMEWTRRQDRYFTREQSGAPEQGDREVSFEADAFGGSFGLRFDSADSGAGRVTVGAALRYVPALEFDADQVLTLLSGDSVASIPAERESGWEGGLSARYFFTPAFAALAAFGTRTEQEWKGLGVTSGTLISWRTGIQFHDSRDPWAFRFGVGGDHQDGSPEPRAAILGIGFSWDFEGVLIDLGLQHASIDRNDEPRSYEDRVVGTVVIGF
jgi:hypothetical protein